MPRLPPVLKSPHTRLRATFCAGVGNSVVTFDQSHSSSSATNCAKPVSVPCPISERAIRITTVSSGRISTQALTSLAVAAARTSALPPNGILKPSARPLPAAAVRIRNERRSIVNELLIMALPSLRLCGRVNRLPHLLKGAAAADIGGAGQTRLLPDRPQQRGRGIHIEVEVLAVDHQACHSNLLIKCCRPADILQRALRSTTAGDLSDWDLCDNATKRTVSHYVEMLAIK